MKKLNEYDDYSLIVNDGVSSEFRDACKNQIGIFMENALYNNDNITDDVYNNITRNEKEWLRLIGIIYRQLVKDGLFDEMYETVVDKLYTELEI